MKILTATDRKALIRLASTLPAGSEERKAILAGLNKSGASRRDVVEEYARFIKGAESAEAGLKALRFMFKNEGFTTRELDRLIKVLGSVRDDRTLEQDVKDLLAGLGKTAALPKGSAEGHGASLKRAAGLNEIIRFIDKVNGGGKEWEYRFWGIDSKGEKQMFKAWGDGDGLYNASVEDPRFYTGRENILWGMGGSGLSNDTGELAKVLRPYRLKNISWDRVRSAGQPQAD